MGNLEILLYFDEIIKWLLFPIRLGNFGKSWEILGNLEILFISMKLSNGCCFRFAWEILGNLGKSWEILGILGKSWEILDLGKYSLRIINVVVFFFSDLPIID